MVKNITLFVFAVASIILISLVSIANYQQHRNITQVLAQNLDGRLVPHKANYQNKLNNILGDGIRSFEFDTLFNNQTPKTFFEIGHDVSELTGGAFEDYLQIVQDKAIKKIWMDIKNVEASNITQILNRLNTLDNQYALKEILIFETSTTSPKLKSISDAGYHTSYYLPTAVLQAMSENKSNEILKEAARIRDQIEAQNLNAISFPLPLYAFVKMYLEPIIPNDVVYHVWETYKFKRKNELQNLQSKSFYRDTRVKTILYTYYNNKLNRLYTRR